MRTKLEPENGEIVSREYFDKLLKEIGETHTSYSIPILDDKWASKEFRDERPELAKIGDGFEKNGEYYVCGIKYLEATGKKSNFGDATFFVKMK